MSLHLAGMEWIQLNCAYGYHDQCLSCLNASCRFRTVRQKWTWFDWLNYFIPLAGVIRYYNWRADFLVRLHPSAKLMNAGAGTFHHCQSFAGGQKPT